MFNISSIISMSIVERSFVMAYKKFFIIVAFTSLIIFIGSCSKKDVTQGEPSFTVSDTDTSGEHEFTEEPVETEKISSDLQTVYFAFDSYALSNEARRTLKDNAEWLKKNPTAMIQIEGHCDERGTTEYNLALGERRANAASEYLKSLGIQKSRISIISYGEERPVDNGHDETAWAKNRRAEFVVLSK